MASPTLLYIAWPVTLGLSFIAGSMSLSPEKGDNPKATNQNGNKTVQTAGSGAGFDSSTTSSRTNPRSNTGARNRSGSVGSPESFDVKQITHLNDPNARLSNFLKMVNSMGPGDFEQTVADFRALGITEDRMAEYELLLHAWAKQDPEAALAYAKENTRNPFASQTILASWAAYNPDAALNWVKTNFEGKEANRYLVGIVKGLADTNPARATEILQGLPYSRERGEALRSVLPHISKLGTEEAIAWLGTIKDEKLRAGASATLAENLAENDPEGAAKWVNTLDKEAQLQAAGEVAREWAKQDLTKAVEWTSSLTGTVKTSAASRVMREFVSSDPEKAATWMKTMSGEEGYQNVVRSFMFSSFRKNPELAMNNLSEVDEQWRDRSRDMMLMGWAAQDKDAANTWMQSNNVDAEKQKQIIERVESGKRMFGGMGGWNRQGRR